QRCNGNLDKVLIFFAINTVFIIVMQHPLDTTNTLWVQLQITLYCPSAAQASLSPFTDYSPSNVWMQALAYAKEVDITAGLVVRT
ncbi:hypothetical protein F4604DRAFT_1582521, partial [Suillus subluteus]